MLFICSLGDHDNTKKGVEKKMAKQGALNYIFTTSEEVIENTEQGGIQYFLSY